MRMFIYCFMMQIPTCFNAMQLGMREYSKLNLDFLLKKLSCISEDIFILDEEEHEIPPFAAKFCSVQGQEHILAVASENGDVLLLDTNRKAKNSLIKQWKAHYNAIFDICWLNGECKLITASGDRTSILWDVIHGEKLAIFKGHKSSIKNIQSRPESQCVFATASRDGSIRIWDTRCNKSQNDISYEAEMTIRDAHNAASVIPGTPKRRKKKEVYSTSGNPLNSVTSIAFQDENLLFSAGTADGVIKVWDLRRNYLAAKKEVTPYIKFPYKGNSTKAHGFTSLVFNDCHSVLYANCTDSVIYAYNASSYSPVPLATYYGHKTSTFFVKMAISRGNEYLLSGSSDNHAYIWKTSQSGQPLFRLTGHQAEVTAVAWNSNDITKVVTCGDDVQVIFWSIRENSSEMSGKCINKPLGKSEVISDAHSPLEIGSTIDYCFNNVECDLQSTAANFSSPQTSNVSNSPNSCVSSPDITRWFKPNTLSVANCHTNSTVDSSNEHNYFPRKRTISHTIGNILPCLQDELPNEERENYRLSIPKPITSPDESRVFSAKKPINNANCGNVQTARRSLNMDSPKSNTINKYMSSSESSNCKDCSEWRKDKDHKTSVAVKGNVGKDNEERCKFKKTSHQQNRTKYSRPSCIKLSACSGQMALITNYFTSAEDVKSSALPQSDTVS